METERQFEDDQDAPTVPSEPPAETPDSPEMAGNHEQGGDVPSFFSRQAQPEEQPSDSMSQFISRTMASVAEAEPEADTGLIPRASRTFGEVGLSKAFLTDLTLKIMHFSGTPSMAQLSKRLGLHPEIVNQIVQSLQEERLVDVLSQSDLYTGNYRYRLSERGQTRVIEALERTRYAGPAPVTANQYTAVMEKLFEEKQQISRAEITEALSDLVLKKDNIDAVARAIFSGKSAILYGPSGNGKTVILENFAKALTGHSVMPYAIYAYGQVIRVFDASLHVPLEEQPEEETNSVKDDQNIDRRWIKVKRPAIILGAEMDRDALDLGYDPSAKFYQAPAHIKAQNGVLIVDDFGRQRVTTTDLLTRWLIPLERGSDTLSMVTGEKLTVPFRLQLLFATNARVRDVADEAMLRRILYKVRIPNPDEEGFGEILRRECAAKGVTIKDDDAIHHAVHTLFGEPNLKVRASYARDLVDILVESANFDGTVPVLDRQTFDHVFSLFIAGASDEEKLEDEDY
jgi:predicted ATPase with chaperone activity